MDSKSISLALSIVGTGVEAVVLFYMFRSKGYKTYPALMGYLALAILFDVTFGVLPWGPHSISGVVRYRWYLWGYWSTYLLSAGLLLLNMQSIFREVMSPLSGLSRLGVVAFRWVVCISIIVAIGASYMPVENSKFPVTIISGEIMRCVSVLELCLLAFITLVLHRLGLSLQSRPFGISLGFGMMACMDLLRSAVGVNHQTVFSTMNTVSQMVMLSGICIWAFYFAHPEPARSPMTISSTSPILRWNEVAMALGKAVPQTAPVPAFFLSDVEQVVDKVLIKNSFKVTAP